MTITEVISKRVLISDLPLDEYNKLAGGIEELYESLFEDANPTPALRYAPDPQMIVAALELACVEGEMIPADVLAWLFNLPETEEETTDR